MATGTDSQGNENAATESAIRVSCPTCGGVLEGQATVRCKRGHEFSVDELAGLQPQLIDVALWTAIRVLEDSANVDAHLAARATDRGHHDVSASYRASRSQKAELAGIIRRICLPKGELPAP
jgi:hypothetical protein